METQAFSLLRAMEQSWWYRARADVVAHLFESFLNTGLDVRISERHRHTGVKAPKQHVRILDAGAGFGGMCDTLVRFGPVTAFEPYSDAADACRQKPYESLFVSLDSLEKAGARFNAVGAFDVLEHVEDDFEFLSRLAGMMEQGALFVATIPAFRFLWSKHDVVHKHFRRYSKREVIALFRRAGFDVVYASYWNFLLFPLALCMRLLGFTGESSLKTGSLKDRFLYRMTRIETNRVPGMRFPWGTGIAVAAVKR